MSITTMIAFAIAGMICVFIAGANRHWTAVSLLLVVEFFLVLAMIGKMIV